jgi:hypothetical protein
LAACLCRDADFLFPWSCIDDLSKIAWSLFLCWLLGELSDAFRFLRAEASMTYRLVKDFGFQGPQPDLQFLIPSLLWMANSLIPLAALAMVQRTIGRVENYLALCLIA